jgi:hypothetical protein
MTNVPVESNRSMAVGALFLIHASLVTAAGVKPSIVFILADDVG